MSGKDGWYLWDIYEWQAEMELSHILAQIIKKHLGLSLEHIFFFPTARHTEGKQDRTT